MAQPPKKRPNVEDLVRRWEADKKRSRLFLQIAEEYRKDDFVDAALTVLREGLKHHANFAPAHVALARCYMAKRQWTEAQGELERVHEKSPDNLLAGKLLVEVLEERGEKARALQVAKELVPFAAFDDPEVEATAKRLETELGGVAVPAGKEASDTMDFAAAEDTGELRSGDAETTANFEAESADDTASFETGGPVAGVGEETELIDADAFSAEEPIGDEPAAPATAAGPFGAGAEEESPADVTTPEAEPFGAAAEEESPADVTTPEAEPFGAAPPGPLPGSEGEVPDELLGSAAPEPASGEDDDLTSVTLAELYEAQDSHDEAAAIYEKLLGKRPDDPELRAALERCRSRMQAPANQEPVPEPAEAAGTGEVPAWEPEPAPVPAAPGPLPEEEAGPEPSPEQWKAVLAQYEDWLAAARAVRQ